MILSPTERLHSQFQHPIDHGHERLLLIILSALHYPSAFVVVPATPKRRMQWGISLPFTHTSPEGHPVNFLFAQLLHFWRFVANTIHCLSVGQTPSEVGLLNALAFIPSLNRSD